MSNRFTDNVTPLNAEILNQFEEDMKRYFNFPVYDAVYETSTNSTFFNYAITDEKFGEALYIGYTFILKPDVSTQGTSNQIIAISHDGYGDPLYWREDGETPTIGYDYARVNEERYLVGGKAYMLRCFAKVQNNYQFMIVNDFTGSGFPAAGKTQAGGIKAWSENAELNIENK